MRVGGIGAGNLSVYQDYTSILQKSANIRTAKEPAQENSIAPKEAAPQKFVNDAPKTGNLTTASDSLATIQDFGIIGRDSSLKDLDVGKAISDMKKDSILQDYQYFVGAAF